MKPLYLFGKVVVQPFLKFLYPTKALGKARKKIKPAILTANHLAAIDSLLVAAHHPYHLHFVAKKEMFNTAFKRWVFRNVGAVGVDRGKPDLQAIKTIIKLLKQNKSIGIFPEGTRNKSDSTDMLKISGGASMFAIKSHVPIVPMIFWRRPGIFKRNYLLVGDPFELTEFYEQRVNSETLASANKIVAEKMLEVRQMLDYYVMLKGKQKKAVGKELKNKDIPFISIVEKYRQFFEKTNIVAEIETETPEKKEKPTDGNS